MPSTAELTQVGKREDLADLIAVADAKATPVSTMIKKGKPVANTFVEWQLDGYDTPRTTGALDGEDVSAFEDAAKDRARVGVYIQELRRTPKVNQMAEEISVVAGINSPDPQGVRGSTEYARAKAKKTVEIKRDIETTLLSNNETRQQNGNDAYLTRGLGRYIQNAAQAVHPIPAAYRTPAASVFTGAAIATFTEDSLRALLQSRWGAVGSSDNLVMVCGAAVKNRVTDFTRYEPNVANFLQVRRFNSSNDGKISSSVDMYEGDYGKVEIHLSNFVPTPQTGYILDMRGLELRTKGNPEYKDLPDNGGGPRGLIRAIIALCVHNPLSHCKIDANA
jgi:hypothetical protein